MGMSLRSGMSLSFVRRLAYSLFALLPFGLSAVSFGAETRSALSLPHHPNHYILLVDASGSTVSNAAQSARYRQFLTITLRDLLYRDGFGAVVPPYLPEQDYLTILDFGIVDAGVSRPYQALKTYDLTRDYIHSRVARRPGLEKSQFSGLIWPPKFYMMTILSWAKSLALARLMKNPFDGECNRNFLIIIHDGIINGETIQEEVSLAELWADPSNLTAVRRDIDAVNTRYIFTSGDRKESAAWSKAFDHVFVEAYEVWPRERLIWESQVLALDPFRRVSFQWEKEAGPIPLGALTIEMAADFLKRVDGNGIPMAATIRQDGVVRTHASKVTPEIKIPFAAATALTCQPAELQYSIQIRIPWSDRYLGRETILHTSEGAVSPPPPGSCTFMHLIRLGVLVVGVLLMAAAIAWYLYYSRIATHIRVQFPGCLRPIRLMWKANEEARKLATPVQPIIHREAFRVLVPSRWKQRLFFRGVRLSIKSDERISGGEGGEIRFPVRKEIASSRGIIFEWKILSRETLTVFIDVARKNKSFQYTVKYPQGFREEGDNDSH